MPRFRPVTEDLVRRLRDAVGPPHVLVRAEDLERYARDETEDLRYPPEVVVRPAATEEVAAVLALAHAADVPVTPRGGGTGLSGGALAVHGGIALSLERMDRILEIDVGNRMAVVRPGVVNQALKDAAAARGLWYPPDPASLGSCTLGGNLAENAGGPHGVKYGLTRDYVLALEAVLSDGRVLRTGGKLRKDAAGYSLHHLLVGSEGTLAVVTEATLRLVPLPAARRLMVAPFPSLAAAARAVQAVLASPVVPSVLEILGRSALLAAAAHLGRPVPFADREALLLVEVDGADPEAVDRDAERTADLLARSGAGTGAGGGGGVVLADSPAKERDLWEVRRCLGEAVKRRGLHVECDTAVPPARVPDLFRVAEEVAREHGVTEISYGHAGDGNVHVNLLAPPGAGAEAKAALHAAAEEVFRRSAALGGTITGEHGVGCAKRAWLPLCRDPVALEVLRRIKTALDPKGILNPGKILPGA